MEIKTCKTPYTNGNEAWVVFGEKWNSTIGYVGFDSYLIFILYYKSFSKRLNKLYKDWRKLEEKRKRKGL